jgi:hypothetical protein
MVGQRGANQVPSMWVPPRGVGEPLILTAARTGTGALSPRRPAEPLNRQPQFGSLVFDPFVRFLWRGADLHSRLTLRGCSTNERGYIFFIVLRLDPGEQFVQVLHFVLRQ